MHHLGLCVLLASSNAQGARGDHKKSLEAHARRYFDVWNAHDVPGLRALFAAEATLRDWDLEKSGADAVAAANGNIFSSVPGIKIEVLTVHVSGATSTAACEILVRTNNEKGDVLKVVDMITFDKDGLITSVRAYKG